MEPEGGQTGWLSDRLGLGDIARALSARRVPGRHLWHYLGGASLMLLLVQVVSGILLLLYYEPSTSRAFDSVSRIAGEIPYGNLIRGVHLWASDLFVAAAILHVVAVVIRRSYVAPRELGWLTGGLALIVGVLLAFTGAILPWSQRAYTQARVASELAGHTPLLGEWLKRFLRGGEEVSASTLGHAFGFHVAALPAMATLVVALHLFVLRQKERAVAEEAPEVAIPIYPDFLLRQAALWTLVLIILLTLATFAPRALGEAADPRLATPADAGPPWYFLWAHQIIRGAPREILGVPGPRFVAGASGLLAAAAALLPFLDKRGSKVPSYVASGLFVVLALLTAYALT